MSAVLVDTSVWIEYLDRVNPLVENEMDNLLLAGEVMTAGLILAELRRGCRRPEQVVLLLDAMSPLDYHEVDQEVWLQAGKLAAEGAARGLKLQIANCLLAALARREECQIFTLDRDFEHIPGIKLYRVRPD
jgi:predicted nucleic acid-binding protein